MTEAILNLRSPQELTALYTSPQFEAYHYQGHDLGATYTPEATTWKVWSPVAEAVCLTLYTTGSNEEPGAKELGRYPLQYADRGVWQLTLPGQYHGVYYTYTVTALGQTQETADVYAKAAGVNGLRSMVVDLKQTNPDGWEDDAYVFNQPSTHAIIWETHVRDFSIAASSGMRHKGKFLAFTETGTTVNHDGVHPTGLDYLKGLGITHVHLMPVFDFATIDEAHPEKEQYNWGYDPLNYNVPEGSYATNPYDGSVRIREMKAMILALHKAGIGVIMDVVYNHTYHTQKSWFHKTVPYYYHRITADGHFGNASGCGNETASERFMMRRYMLDSILYWSSEYHIDGFRFDLMGVHDVDTMNQIRWELDAQPKGWYKLMYGEPWSALTPCMPEGVIPANKWNAEHMSRRIAFFDDETRDCIKGSAFDVRHTGFVNGGCEQENQLEWAIRAHSGPGRLFKTPSQVVTYVSSHDNFTLWDKITLTVQGDGSGYDTPELIRIAVNKMAAALILTSQGISFFQSGEEFGRTKYGDANSYRSLDRINALNWERTITFAELLRYYQGLIRIRKYFSPFMEFSNRSVKSIHFTTLEEYVVAYTLEGKKVGEPVMAAICFNAGPYRHTIQLESRSGRSMPECWEIVADETYAGETVLREVWGSRLPIFERGVLIAFSKETIQKARDQK